MGRRITLIASIVVILLLNAVLIYRGVRGRQKQGDELDRAQARRDERAADVEKNDAKASKLITEWNEAEVTSLQSEDLAKAVQVISSKNCRKMPKGAAAIDRGSLSPYQDADLNSAIIGLLKAYGASNPIAVIDYMRDRGKSFDSRLQPVLKKTLSRRGQSDLEGMSDSDLYIRLWKTLKIQSQWSGVVASESCVQLWDGNNIAADQITQFDWNEATNPGAMETELKGVFRGIETLRHHFDTVKGSLEKQLIGDRPVLLADVRLIIEFNESKFNEKAAYLCRFWFNSNADKWQPIVLLGFASHPGSISLPELMF